jgi:hypothetical protein
MFSPCVHKFATFVENIAASVGRLNLIATSVCKCCLRNVVLESGERQPDFFTAALVTKSDFDLVYSGKVRA